MRVKPATPWRRAAKLNDSKWRASAAPTPVTENFSYGSQD
jgi:hypothetical protein